jgi:PadR family transcriptional regulator, regulatory protein PadR
MRSSPSVSVGEVGRTIVSIVKEFTESPLYDPTCTDATLTAPEITYSVGKTPEGSVADHLGELEQVLLFALVRLGADAYGASIRREVEQQTGRSLSPGAIYTVMDRLELRGFVTSRLGDATPVRGGRRKKLYRLEPAGARALSGSYERLQRMAQGTLAQLGDLARGVS